MTLAVLLLALAIDRCWGEPRAAWHPVVWMGRYLAWAGARVQRQAVQTPQQADYRAFWCAALYWLLGALAVLAAAWLV